MEICGAVYFNILNEKYLYPFSHLCLENSVPVFICFGGFYDRKRQHMSYSAGDTFESLLGRKTHFAGLGVEQDGWGYSKRIGAYTKLLS